MAAVDALRTRRTFARLNKTQDVPNLIDIQRRSFEWLTDPQNGGLRETIDDISPIEDYTGNLAVQFGEFTFDEPVAGSVSHANERRWMSMRLGTSTVFWRRAKVRRVRRASTAAKK